jgi:hypothetical protein
MPTDNRRTGREQTIFVAPVRQTAGKRRGGDEVYQKVRRIPIVFPAGGPEGEPMRDRGRLCESKILKWLALVPNVQNRNRIITGFGIKGCNYV